MALVLLMASAWAERPAEELKVISARFGLTDYSLPGLRSGDFGIRPAGKIPRSEKYFGWMIEVKCPAGMGQVDWVETTVLPGKYAGLRPGKSADDPAITVGPDLQSFVTRRATPCRNGVARLEDLYRRDDGMPAGPWHITVRTGKQVLAEFRFLVE